MLDVLFILSACGLLVGLLLYKRMRTKREIAAMVDLDQSALDDTPVDALEEQREQKLPPRSVMRQHGLSDEMIDSIFEEIDKWKN